MIGQAVARPGQDKRPPGNIAAPVGVEKIPPRDSGVVAVDDAFDDQPTVAKQSASSAIAAGEGALREGRGCW